MSVNSSASAVGNDTEHVVAFAVYCCCLLWLLLVVVFALDVDNDSEH